MEQQSEIMAEFYRSVMKDRGMGRVNSFLPLT